MKINNAWMEVSDPPPGNTTDRFKPTEKGGKSHWVVDYNGTKSFITTFSDLFALKLGMAIRQYFRLDSDSYKNPSKKMVDSRGFRILAIF